MGYYIFAAAAFLEILLFVTDIVARQTHKLKVIIRWGGVAAFGLLLMLGVIRWSFRWYLLGILLLSLGLNCLRKGRNNVTYLHRFSRLVLTILLSGLAVMPVIIFPQFQTLPVTGDHTVLTAKATYTDENRNETFSSKGGKRQVNVEFWYPGNKGSYPLIIFSHGAFGIKTSNSSTFRELASHGYVVCSIDHPYHSFITIGGDHKPVIIDKGFLDEVNSVQNNAVDGATKFVLIQKWMKLREDDINFVINTIKQKTNSPSGKDFYQNIDSSNIGLMGHSLGGESVAQVARQRHDIGAVVNLDSDLQGEYLNDSYELNKEIYPVPILSLISESTEKLIKAVPDFRKKVAVVYVSINSPKAQVSVLPGTNHMSLTDLPTVSPLLVNLINKSYPKSGGNETDPSGTTVKINKMILDFFDTHLKNGQTQV